MDKPQKLFTQIFYNKKIPTKILQTTIHHFMQVFAVSTCMAEDTFAVH